MTKSNIYVLLLKDERYYIGKSNNVKNRFQQHLNGYGSAWTKKYKPIKIIKTIENISPFEEDKITKEYMSKYGIDKVRGGSYVELELSEFHIAALNMEIWGAKDLCSQCGRKGHFIKDCYAKNDESSDDSSSEDLSDEEIEVFCCSYCDKEFDTLKGVTCHENLYCKNKNNKTKTETKNICYTCGRKGHYSNDCYASTHIKGYKLD